jgi:hypothetical protein
VLPWCMAYQSMQPEERMRERRHGNHNVNGRCKKPSTQRDVRLEKETKKEMKKEGETTNEGVLRTRIENNNGEEK